MVRKPDRLQQGGSESPELVPSGFLAGAIGFAVMAGFGVLTAIVVGWRIAVHHEQTVAPSRLAFVLSGLAATAVMGVIWLLKTLMERRALRSVQAVRFAAKHDALTGLINRGELFRQLDIAIAKANRSNTVVGVLFLDLDHFKQINDTLGHEVGDEVLKVAADRLRGTIRSSDIACRLGGDEFVVVCTGLIAAESVQSVASQIIKSFSQPLSLGGKTQSISTSIGIAVAHPNDERGPDELLRDADAAMYRAKQERGGFSVFDDRQRSDEAQRFKRRTELGEALSNNQLVVMYQPIIDVESSVLVGAEALVRWEHPQLGLIPPAQFLDVAAEAGLMADLGKQVLREACAQAAVWQHDRTKKSSRFAVGLNLSAEQVQDLQLRRLVMECIAWAGISPGQVVLEVSEEVLVAPVRGVDNRREVLTRLRDAGLLVAVDSFGLGGLSIGDLVDMACFDYVKIDRRLTRGIVDHPDSEPLVRAIVRSMQELGLGVVAEGVETQEQLEAFRALGVDLMQGFYFDQPVYADMIESGRWASTRPENSANVS